MQPTGRVLESILPLGPRCPLLGVEQVDGAIGASHCQEVGMPLSVGTTTTLTVVSSSMVMMVNVTGDGVDGTSAPGHTGHT